MRIIDEKGRLLGKINVIDFFAAIFIVSLTPVFYFGYKTFHKQPANVATQNVEMQEKQYMEVDLSFVFKKISPQVLSLISVGDKEIDNDKKIMGQILYLGEATPHSYEVVVGREKKAIADSSFRDLQVTLRIIAEVKQNNSYYNLYYKDRHITDDSFIDFVTDKYKLKAFYMPN